MSDLVLDEGDAVLTLAKASFTKGDRKMVSVLTTSATSMGLTLDEVRALRDKLTEVVDEAEFRGFAAKQGVGTVVSFGYGTWTKTGKNAWYNEHGNSTDDPDIDSAFRNYGGDAKILSEGVTN